MLHRRQLLTAALATIPAALHAALPVAAVSPDLIAAAKKEGKVTQYSSNDLTLATTLAKAFEAKYPGINVQLERSGAERNYQRISQEYSSNIRVVDTVTSSDISYLAAWIKSGLIVPYVTEEAMHLSADAREEGGFYAKETFSLMIPAYNQQLVKDADVPKSWADLLHPKWHGKMVKAHPGYSGNIMTGTYILSKTLGWEYFEKLSKQKIMQVQSAVDPAQRVAQGERQIAADGSENAAFRTARKGGPVVPIYPTEGCPVVPTGIAIMAAAPHPNAARLLAHFVLSADGQQILADYGGRSFLPRIAVPAGLKPTGELKLLHADPAAVALETEAIRKRYTQLFAI
ncbi:MAG: extracellular solute-binding protein [Acetobacteraceae bacterium]|nr:extracellular solute-binding protein [Acetobacteraceae bacterium]